MTMHDEQTQQKINQLQQLEQGLQNFSMQKQQVNTKISEQKSALEEIENTDTSYKIIGNIMIKTDKDTLKKELDDKIKRNEIMIKSLEKQENNMREKAKSIQKEVMENISRNEK